MSETSVSNHLLFPPSWKYNLPKSVAVDWPSKRHTTYKAILNQRWFLLLFLIVMLDSLGRSLVSPLGFMFLALSDSEKTIQMIHPLAIQYKWSYIFYIIIHWLLYLSKCVFVSGSCKHWNNRTMLKPHVIPLLHPSHAYTGNSISSRDFSLTQVKKIWTSILSSYVIEVISCVCVCASVELYMYVYKCWKRWECWYTSYGKLQFMRYSHGICEQFPINDYEFRMKWIDVLYEKIDELKKNKLGRGDIFMVEHWVAIL